MAASPQSTVSSDLYSPAVPSQSEVHPQGGPFREDANQESFDDGCTEAEGSEYSDMMQGLDSAGEDASRPSSVAAGPAADVMLPETVYKRKRDLDLESEQTVKDSKDVKEGLEWKIVPMIASSDEFPNEKSLQWQDSVPLDNVPTAKRIKPNGRPLILPLNDITVSCKVSALPAALWQYIFCFVPPVFLGRLLSVNRAFKSYLDPGEEIHKSGTLTAGIVHPLTAEAIWTASRRRFAPGLPRPIHGLQELDMWRLLVGQNCQSCGRIGSIPTPKLSGNAWELGPGASGVRIIWPFGIRCCGPCLQDFSKKEWDLYLSAECPSFLLQALPFAFISDGNHYIGHNFLRSQRGAQITPLMKHFHKPAIKSIMYKFEEAKTLGPASVEEWLKGLASQGQKHLEDIIRWEQWESKGGLKKVNSRPAPKPIPIDAAAMGKRSNNVKDDSNSDRSTPLSSVASTKGYQPNPGPSFLKESPHVASNPEITPVLPAWNIASHFLVGPQDGRQMTFHQPRPERNLRDVNGAKLARRTEIERRCAALNPPLLPNILNHMESFQAAMQITQPMTDQAWQILKPRLLAQLPYAERKEKERVQQKERLEEECRQRRHQEAQLKETKESCDREWETFQNPVRNRLGALADLVVESRWAGGRSVTKETSPKFAADVLLNVRQRFYAEIAQEDEAAAAAGERVMTDPLNGPPTRTLILENMKWLFDTKIKPLTDHLQRELFLCNGCDGNFKFYGFEGVIQHYAAKHTTALSMGNIVVHWRAEWPEHPPFNPNPSVAKSSYYKLPTPATPVQALTARDTQGPTAFGSFNQAGYSAPLMAPQEQESLQHSAHTHTNLYRGNQQEGHHAIPGQPSLLNTMQGAGDSYPEVVNGHAASAVDYNQFAAVRQPQTAPPYSCSFPNEQVYPVFAPGQSATNVPGNISGLRNNHYGSSQSMPYPSNIANGVMQNHAPNVHGPVSDLYQRQMDDLAKHAKDVFTSLGGVKDLPGSVRIYVVIHLTVSRFKASFPNEPSLSMFIDGLDHNPVMRPVRSVNGLGCKTCMSSNTGAKLFTLPHLVNHFRTVHVESPQVLGHPHVRDLDWKVDMIDLPDASIISTLVHAPGMTESKLAVITSVFHGLLPFPLPNLRGKTNTGPLPNSKREPDMNLMGTSRVPANGFIDDTTESVESSKEQPSNRSCNGFQPLINGPPSEPTEPPREDEYDPHRPAVLSKTSKADINSSQSHKLARPSLLGSGQGPSLHPRYESNRHVSSRRLDEQHVFFDSSVTPSNGGDRHASGIPGQSQTATPPSQPLPNFVSQPKGRLDVVIEKQSMPQHWNEINDFDSSMGYHARHRRILDNGASSEFEECGVTSVSPQKVAENADRFLSSLGHKVDVGYLARARPLDREPERLLQAPWQQAEPLNSVRNFGQDGIHDNWSSNGNSLTLLERDSPKDRLCTEPLELRNGSQNGAMLDAQSGKQYFENYRPPSYAQKAFVSLRSDGTPNVGYESQQSVVHERRDMAGVVIKRPRSGSHAYSGTHIAQYRPESELQSEVLADTALYRPRSPIEEDRGGTMYHARSPPSRLDRLQRVANYEYPAQARYEYVDDYDVREPQYQQRIEYVRVPARYEEPRFRETPARYVLSRPVEQLKPEYVRYEHSEANEPVFERNGQSHLAPQRAYHEQPTRATPSFTSNYEY